MKYNVLRKNLQTNTVDYGDVDPIFEAINLAAESKEEIVIDSPWIEIMEDSEDAVKHITDIKIEAAKTAKENEVLEAYEKAQFAYIQYGMSVFKIKLKGDDWNIDFKGRILSAVALGKADLIVDGEDGSVITLKGIPLETLTPLFNKLEAVSVGNFALKRQLLKIISNPQTLESLADINVTFPDAKVFTV